MAAPVPGQVPLWTWLPPLAGIAAAIGLGANAPLLVALPLAALLLASVLAAVHHAHLLADRLGEPLGTLVLTLAVTVIELSLILALMLGPDAKPAIARDSVHAVVVLVLHGVAGLSILVAAFHHRAPEFQVEGANAFLSVLLPMAVLVLVLPNFVVSAPGPAYSALQLGFVAAACLALYLAFLFIQTVRHQEYFQPQIEADAAHRRPGARAAAIAAALLLVALGAVVLLAKALAPAIGAGVAAIGAPAQLAGVVVAAIVLLPETLSAVAAARANRLQASLNLALGSAVACIGLTVPAVAALALITDRPLTLGIDAGQSVMLALSFAVAMLTYGLGRTTLLAGCVHLVLLGVWLGLIFAP